MSSSAKGRSHTPHMHSVPLALSTSNLFNAVTTRCAIIYKFDPGVGFPSMNVIRLLSNLTSAAPASKVPMYTCDIMTITSSGSTSCTFSILSTAGRAAAGAGSGAGARAGARAGAGAGVGAGAGARAGNRLSRAGGTPPGPVSSSSPKSIASSAPPLLGGGCVCVLGRLTLPSAAA